MARRATITGWGKCRPPLSLTNAHLEKLVDTSDDWIVDRTGIESRGMNHAQLTDMAEVAGWHALATAGLDVTEQEPIANDNPLIKMDNTVITPHALCWTDECFEDIARTALRSIVDVSLGRTPAHVVS